MSMVHVRIFYPADPVGVVPGGIDTFIRGIIKSAPPDVVISLVGMSTDPVRRPPGVWTTCHVGHRAFAFFPVVVVDDAGQRGRVPLSVRFMAGVWRHGEALQDGFDVFDFHRIEPLFQYESDPRPKNVFFHQDPGYLRLQASDNLWRRMPAVYEKLEARAMRSVASAWCVRESGVKVLCERYPTLSRQTRFVPTWVDTDVFSPVSDAARLSLRAQLADRLGLDLSASWVISVGRLDTQKNPQRLLQAVTQLHAQGRPLHWLVVGDGVLQSELSQAVVQRGLSRQVRFMGLLPPTEIAQWLCAADVFALSSAYEGMPMALLEALGCGLPAVVTDVGEVRRVVLPGRNGAIASDQSDEAFTQALREGLDHAAQWRGAPACDAVAEFQPDRVLAPVYDNYRTLALAAQSESGLLDPLRPLPHHHVIGVRVHSLTRQEAMARMLDWAQRRESRSVCFCNAHSAVLASSDPEHQRALAEADLVAPDGAPIAWTMSLKRGRPQQRVDGPGTMLQLCQLAAEQGVRIGLLGSTPEVLKLLVARLQGDHPALQVAYVCSPPFRALSPAEEQALCDDIAAAGVGLLFVGLGCPKQETWMRRHRGRVPAVMLGVGAAFDFHAGTMPRAPSLMRGMGLEWLHRLASEPRRLWWRYLSYNTVFVSKSLLDLSQVMWRRCKALLHRRTAR